MRLSRFYYRRMKICLKAGSINALRAQTTAQGGLKRVLVFLAMRRCIPARMAESLIRRLGLIHA
jgi:hypothetical protein